MIKALLSRINLIPKTIVTFDLSFYIRRTESLARSLLFQTRTRLLNCIRQEEQRQSSSSLFIYRKPPWLIRAFHFSRRQQERMRWASSSLTHADSATGINVSVTRFRVTVRLPNSIALIGRFLDVFLFVFAHASTLWRGKDTKGRRQIDKILTGKKESLDWNKSYSIYCEWTFLTCGTKIKELFTSLFRESVRKYVDVLISKQARII